MKRDIAYKVKSAIRFLIRELTLLTITAALILATLNFN